MADHGGNPRSPPLAGGRMRLACLTVFVSSTCGLVVELVAGRILAPYVGVSLYTWTSIIGVVLAGLSLGSYLGGVIADRGASRSALGLTLVAGGLASAGILVTTDVVVAAQTSLPLPLKIVAFTAGIFLLPSLILGTISPLVVKLALADLRRAGRTVGTIYACSAAGSIFGTFVAGFWLVSWIGTRATVWLVAAILLAMGVLLGGSWRSRSRLATLAVTLLACGVAVWTSSTHGFRWLPAGAAGILPGYSAPVVALVPIAIVVAAVVAPRLEAPAVALAIAVVGLVGIGWQANLYRAPCQVESSYYCIRVDEQIAGTQEGDRDLRGVPQPWLGVRTVRVLVLDHLIHSYVVPDDPRELAYGYERVYAEVTRYYEADHQDLDTLFIGGGGYTFPRYVETVYPTSTVDVIEIDPAVTRVAREYLGLSPATRIRTFSSDARAFLMGWTDPKKYDLVYGDAFNDLSVPYHLTTVEFDRIIADRLKPDGLYMVNVVDRYEGGEFAKAFLNSLRQVFPNVYLMSPGDPRGERWQAVGANTFVLLASRKPLDADRFSQTARAGGPPESSVLSDSRLEGYLSSGRAILLTDDYAPVDQLVARLFAERGF